MAFCTSCGVQLGEGERFCSKCGADQTARAGGAPGAVPVGAPSMAASSHMPYVAPAQIPMSVAMPPQAPAKKSGMMWLGIIIVAAGGYYYYTHYMQPKGQMPGNTPQNQPAQNQPVAPGQQPVVPGRQPTGQQPVGQQPGFNPGQQPGGPGQGSNAQLVRMQSFTGQITVEDGDVEISNGQWTNNSTVAIQAATLECIQYGAGGQELTQNQITIGGPNNEPVQPQHTITFDPFAVGQVLQGATRANCGIVAVVPVG